MVVPIISAPGTNLALDSCTHVERFHFSVYKISSQPNCIFIYLSQVVETVIACRGAGVIHRDIKVGKKGIWSCKYWTRWFFFEFLTKWLNFGSSSQYPAKRNHKNRVPAIYHQLFSPFQLFLFWHIAVVTIISAIDKKLKTDMQLLFFKSQNSWNHSDPDL